MWTARIDKVADEESSQRKLVVVTLTKGAKVIVKDFWLPDNADQDRLKSEIRSYTNSIDNREAKPIVVGTLDLSDPVVVPTPEEQGQIDANKWFRQVNRLRAFKELQALGGMPPAWQADLDALVAKVQADAKKVYLNNL